jgi:hypothetical protein
MSTFTALSYLRKCHAFSDKTSHPALKHTPSQKNMATALLAFDPDVGPHSEHLPLVTATGMLLLQPNYITNPYLHY